MLTIEPFIKHTDNDFASHMDSLCCYECFFALCHRKEIDAHRHGKREKARNAGGRWFHSSFVTGSEFPCQIGWFSKQVIHSPANAAGKTALQMIPAPLAPNET